MKLTATEAKMALEYFAQQAAQDAPVADLDWNNWDSHMWMTNYTASLAVERRINEHDWATLVNAALDLQSFDRDPEGYLNERGLYPADKFTMHEDLQDVLSMSIDTAYNTSKAA